MRLAFDGSLALSSLWKRVNTWSSSAGMLFCCTKLSVKLLSELRYQDMISVQCNVNNLLPNVAFSKEYYRMKIVWVILCQYYQRNIHIHFFRHTCQKRILQSHHQFHGLALFGFIPIAWLSALNSCTRFFNLFAWCKAWPTATKVSEYDQEIPQSNIAGQTRHWEEDRDNIILTVTIHH